MVFFETVRLEMILWRYPLLLLKISKMVPKSLCARCSTSSQFYSYVGIKPFLLDTLSEPFVFLGGKYCARVIGLPLFWMIGREPFWLSILYTTAKGLIIALSARLSNSLLLHPYFRPRLCLLNAL